MDTAVLGAHLNAATQAVLTRSQRLAKRLSSIDP